MVNWRKCKFFFLEKFKPGFGAVQSKECRNKSCYWLFVADKLVAGLKPSFIYGSGSITNSTTIIGIGPLVRYYLLSPENMFNLFTEAGYSYGNIKSKGGGSGQKSNTFSISGGPVLYFNSSVGLEFTCAYSKTKVVGFSGNNNELKFGIGFMFYLEKKE